MTVAFMVGTTAEVIKVAPVMRALREEGVELQLWNTAWHVEGLRATLDDLGLGQPDEHFIAPERQTSVHRTSQVPAWWVRIALHTVRHRRRLRRTLGSDGNPPLVVVHGDTFTTVLGALVGRFLGARIAHVEAGMRSGDLFNPLPEEINRKVAARLSHLHFAPTSREVDNLRRERVRGLVVDTGANTAIDALRMMMGAGETDLEVPDRFGLVTLHRFELVRNGETFTETLKTLHDASRDFPLVMPAGDAERARIDELGLLELFDDRFLLVPKQPYARFLPLLARASFVVTDSGGLQQECGFLGLPCAIHRTATESHHGLGANLLLTGMQRSELERFLADPERWRRPSELDRFHPTEVIVAALRSEGYLGAQRSPQDQ